MIEVLLLEQISGLNEMGAAEPPLAFFVTWTVYGTFLQGDARWWRKKQQGHQPPQPLLRSWHQDRLKHDVVLLNDQQREIVKTEIERHCQVRGWRLWTANPRTNHVHVVVSAEGYSGKVVRDQLKANCTRGIREHYGSFVDRPVWTVGGDWLCINSEEELEQVIIYVAKGREKKSDSYDLQNRPH